VKPVARLNHKSKQRKAASLGKVGLTLNSILHPVFWFRLWKGQLAWYDVTLPPS
jgi:hypothetical protein